MPTSMLPIAIVVASGFDEARFTETQRYLLNAEIPAKIVGPDGGLVQGWHENGWGHHFMTEESLSDVLSADFRALVLVGGARGIVSLQNNPHARRFARAFVQAGKPVAAVGDAVRLLALADVGQGRQFVAPESCANAVRQAGGHVNTTESMLVDGMLLTAADSVKSETLLDTLLELIRSAEAVMENAA